MKVAFDTVRMRPGCAIVQAALGGDTNAAFYFETEDWLPAPTQEMRVYDATDEQLRWLAIIAKEKRESSSNGDVRT